MYIPVQGWPARRVPTARSYCYCEGDWWRPPGLRLGEEGGREGEGGGGGGGGVSICMHVMWL